MLQSSKIYIFKASFLEFINHVIYVLNFTYKAKIKNVESYTFKRILPQYFILVFRFLLINLFRICCKILSYGDKYMIIVITMEYLNSIEA